MKVKEWIIDRWEGDYALCERSDLSIEEIERGKLPSNAREGDCIYQDEKGELHIDPEETARRRRHNAALQKRLFED